MVRCFVRNKSEFDGHSWAVSWVGFLVSMSVSDRLVSSITLLGNQTIRGVSSFTLSSNTHS